MAIASDNLSTAGKQRHDTDTEPELYSGLSDLAQVPFLSESYSVSTLTVRIIKLAILLSDS